MTCRFCLAPHTSGDGHYLTCPVVSRVLGPAKRMCRRCDADALPRRMLCAECLDKHAMPERAQVTKREYEKRRYQKRKAMR